MRTTLIACAAGKLFQAPAWSGNVPARDAGIAAYSEPYVLQTAGATYVADGAYVQYAQPSPYTVVLEEQVPTGSALPSPLNSAMVLLLGVTIGVAAAKHSAPVATLAVTDLEAGEAEADVESDDDMPTPGRLDVSTALANELKNAGLPVPEGPLSAPLINYNKTSHPGHDAIQWPASSGWLWMLRACALVAWLRRLLGGSWARTRLSSTLGRMSATSWSWSTRRR
jgi:hypothetical protein